MEERGAINLSAARCTKEGLLGPQEVSRLVRRDSCLIVMTHASNVTRTVMPVSEVGQIVREMGITFLLDAAQTAGVYPVNADELGVDLLAFTGHKELMGPTGTGGLYIAPGGGVGASEGGGHR